MIVSRAKRCRDGGRFACETFDRAQGQGMANPAALLSPKKETR